MRIDIHSHVIPAKVIEAIGGRPRDFSARIEGQGAARRMIHDQGYVYPLFAEFYDVDAKIEAMDRKRLDISIISPAPPMFHYWADADLALSVAHMVNDGVAEGVAQAGRGN